MKFSFSDLKRLMIGVVFSLSVILLILLIRSFEPPKTNQIASLLSSSSAEGFSAVTPGYVMTFPDDFGAHPSFRHEWWYVTANLKDESGNRYGIQWTLFRYASSPDTGERWNSNQVYMAHSVLTTEKEVYAFERYGRGGIGQAGTQAKPFAIWLDDWRMQSESEQPFPAAVTAGEDDVSYRLSLTQTLPPVLNGDKGYSKKHVDDFASYYFSVPRINIKGTINIGGQSVDVSGLGWFDREWGTREMSPSQRGWSWFSMHLDDGSSLMIAELRGEPDNFAFGTYISSNSDVSILGTEDILLTPVTYRKVKKDKHVPLTWKITLKNLDKQWEVRALNHQNWLDFYFPYWEGPTVISGSSTGTGFMELTGY
ncbi:carotenoid 1,2-hydratase [Veronia nyctiphanis]|uniref:Carotenoid 1,2-hydratase n=1 Tax=Veronia nyctiphanis TaxID=1278244 RepID=A0A4Q0YVK6_9GAMM|nr:lipocalin-like domain-containing protein [Veronia nyctiphanis]RXJ74254.1 carotenoid 1,2-hydratase [Veronia nyctiphanis]